MTVDTRESQKDFDQFLEQISPSLRFRVQMSLFKQLLLKNRQVRIMSKISEETNEALKNFKDYFSFTDVEPQYSRVNLIRMQRL